VTVKRILEIVLEADNVEQVDLMGKIISGDAIFAQ
jgi:hypothetical protein